VVVEVLAGLVVVGLVLVVDAVDVEGEEEEVAAVELVASEEPGDVDVEEPGPGGRVLAGARPKQARVRAAALAAAGERERAGPLRSGLRAAEDDERGHDRRDSDAHRRADVRTELRGPLPQPLRAAAPLQLRRQLGVQVHPGHEGRRRIDHALPGQQPEQQRVRVGPDGEQRCRAPEQRSDEREFHTLHAAHRAKAT
jgi:hypothetical protein